MPDADAMLVSPADVAAASGGQVAAADPRLPTQNKGATDRVRRRGGWHVAPVITETITLDGEGTASLPLPSRRVLDVTSLKINGEDAPADTWDYSQAGMLRLRQGTFPDRFRSVEVTLTHGYADAPAMVSLIIQAVLGACASPMGATREQAGSISASWSRTGLGLTEEDRRTLSRYRLQTWV